MSIALKYHSQKIITSKDHLTKTSNTSLFKEIDKILYNNIVNPLINPWRFVFSDSNKLTLFITKVFGYRPGNNSSTFNVSTHEGAGTFQALANKELTSPKANWASGL
ncbi:hypothetical protein H8356DRAFT_1425465 [Neocallimastix lanati (nom. inval.)]|nr:hypothetical protein H8356DRAFT_1425465 [Neocallimastix sp. JGI-2020a]